MKSKVSRFLIGVMASLCLTAALLPGTAFAADEDQVQEEEQAEDQELAAAQEEEDAQAEDQSQASHAENLIFTYDDLLAIEDDPAGSYELMCDIDMTGKDWEPVDFTGTFNGNGYAIMNCTVTSTTADTRLTYDGNMISYDTVFSGFFGIVEGAEITDLKLLGVDVDVDCEADCFVGGLAGYTDKAEISGCTVEGEVSLYVDGAMFGVGGAVGFGNGEITGCTIDTTLICVDKNAEEKDEQFMGGVNANGYMSIDSCDVTIRGYDSDHGYVHDGGLSGMFILYPEGTDYWGFITNNMVNGYITFFEDNEDRRAYCERAIGEDMSETYDAEGNEYDFERDERFEYDTDLLPEECDDPVYDENVVEANCPDYGYTEYTCQGCGHSYKADYTAPTHTVDGWKTVEEATETEEGLSEGTCSICEKVVYQKIPKLEPTTTTEETVTTTAADVETAAIETVTESTEESTAQTGEQTGAKVNTKVLVIAGIAVIVIVIVLLIVILTVKEKKRRAKARARRLRRQNRPGPKL